MKPYRTLMQAVRSGQQDTQNWRQNTHNWTSRVELLEDCIRGGYLVIAQHEVRRPNADTGEISTGNVVDAAYFYDGNDTGAARAFAEVAENCRSWDHMARVFERCVNWEEQDV